MTRELYGAAAAGVLIAHLLWLLFVIFGAFFTARRPVLTAVHIAALAWGMAVEVGPWPCPLTALEQDLEMLAGRDPYRGSFLVHYLDALVYPDVPESALVAGALAVCLLNLAVYAWRLRSARLNYRAPARRSLPPS